jgi:hypothetical protein
MLSDAKVIYGNTLEKHAAFLKETLLPNGK